MQSYGTINVRGVCKTVINAIVLQRIKYIILFVIILLSLNRASTRSCADGLHYYSFERLKMTYCIPTFYYRSTLFITIESFDDIFTGR